jgi:hypothetical protein
MLRALLVTGSTLLLAVMVGCKSAPAPAAAPPPRTPTPVGTHAPAFGGGSSTAVPAGTPAAGDSSPSSALALRPANATPQPGTSGQALKAPLRLAFAPGMVRRYTINLHAVVSAPLLPNDQRVPAMDGSLKLEYEVLRVNGDGSGVVRASVTSSAIDEYRGATLQLRVTPDGNFSDAQLEREGRPLVRGAEAQKVARDLMVFPYLNGPLYIGDSFDRKLQVSVSSFMPDTTVAVRYTLTEVSNKDGREQARIEAAGNVTGLTIPSTQGVEFSNGRAQVQGSDFVNTDDGWPTAGDSSMVMAFEARSTDGRISTPISARVDQSYRLEQEARGVSL